MEEKPSESVAPPDPLIGHLTAVMKSAGVEQHVVDEVVDWTGDDSWASYDGASTDAEHRASTEAELRAVWKGDYEANVELVRGYVSGNLPPGVADVFERARRRDGRALLNDTALAQKLLGLAKQSVVVLPKVSGDVPAQIAAIEKTMRENRSKYNKDENMQLRYRALLTAREQGR